MIPVCEPNLSGREADLVRDCVKSGWVSSQGMYLDQFQQDLSTYFGIEHFVCVSSGTAALEAACHGIDLQPGDEVIVPSFTIVSVPNVLIRFGAIPVLVDVDPGTWNLDPTEVESHITSKTKAIIVVHSFGHPADMARLCEIAKNHGLKIVEDVAEAIASEYDGQLCGTFGDVATFSFYANKLITTGEGGAVATNNWAMAERIRRYINLYFGDTERFAHTDLGYNYRMTNMQAALGVAQLERIDYFINRKLEIGNLYREALPADLIALQPTSGPVKHVYWMYAVLLSGELKTMAVKIMQGLQKEGVGTRSLFKGLHLQTHLRKYVPDNSLYPVAENLYERGFYLPSSTTLEKDDVMRIAESLKSVIIG